MVTDSVVRSEEAADLRRKLEVLRYLGKRLRISDRSAGTAR